MNVRDGFERSDDGVKYKKPSKFRGTDEFDEDEVDYFIVKEDGDVYQFWRRKVETGGRPLGTMDRDVSDVRKVAELTAEDNGLSRGDIAERVGASKSWVQNRQRELLFL